MRTPLSDSDKHLTDSVLSAICLSSRIVGCTWAEPDTHLRTRAHTKIHKHTEPLAPVMSKSDVHRSGLPTTRTGPLPPSTASATLSPFIYCSISSAGHFHRIRGTWWCIAFYNSWGSFTAVWKSGARWRRIKRVADGKKSWKQTAESTKKSPLYVILGHFAVRAFCSVVVILSYIFTQSWESGLKCILRGFWFLLLNYAERIYLKRSKSWLLNLVAGQPACDSILFY